MTNAASAAASDGSNRNARAVAIRIAARPALNRKNFTPASRETRISVNAMPMPRCARNSDRTTDNDMGRMGGKGWTGRMIGKRRRLGGKVIPPAQPARPALQASVHFRPVDDVPPCVDVVRPAILILQVVRVLPDVEAHDDLLVFHERTVLVRAALDRQLAAVVDQPRPAAAEAADAGFLEFFLEFVEAAERGLDRIGNRAARRPAGLRPHDLPEHRVVRVSAAVVAHRGADVFGHAVDAAQQIFDALRLQLRVLLERCVQIRDVRVVMLAVVNLHRLFVDMRLESIGRVRKRWERVRHRSTSYEMLSMRSRATFVQYLRSSATTMRLCTSPSSSPSSTHRR